MKNFFSLQGKFNIFLALGSLLVILSFFYNKYPINLVGLFIAFIPEGKTSIDIYRKSGKITTFLVLEAILFLTTLYIIISTLLGI